jgi:hypothetical protein
MASSEQQRKASRDSARRRRAKPEARLAEQIRARAWYAKTKEQRREKLQKQRRDWRGLPEATRPAPTLCECCGGAPNGRGTLHLDHDHGTNLFRGWLCHSCNVGMGCLGDSIEGVERALYYLRFISTSNRT